MWSGWAKKQSNLGTCISLKFTHGKVNKSKTKEQVQLLFYNTESGGVSKNLKSFKVSCSKKKNVNDK